MRSALTVISWLAAGKVVTPIPSSPTADARFIFFGGKGGVGKTTCAAATALVLGRGERVLALSLDPAHSLRDVLGENTEFRTQNSEFNVLELDAKAEFAEFMRRHREELRTIADRGTYFDDEDIAGFLELTLPGLDEIMGLLKLGQLAKSPDYDRVIVDLPPTGHALRLFDVSKAFDQLIGVLDLMQEKHRFTVSSLTRRYTPDKIDAFLDDLEEACSAAKESLFSPGTSAFILVAQPQPMVLAETRRYASKLRELGAPLAAVILNASTAASNEPLVELGSLPVMRVPWLSTPPVGRAGLERLAPWLGPLWGEKPSQAATRSDARTAGPATPGDSERRAKNDKAAGPRAAQNRNGAHGLAALLREPRRLLIFGGKGGVGKTTMAAATALALASRQPDRSILVVSIDPAHSLGDSLGQPLGDQPRPVKGHPNLQAVELDPAQRWQAFGDLWAAEGQKIFAGAGGQGHLDPVYDRQIAAELGKIQPSGLDELQAAIAVVELLDEDPRRMIVIDTAPTGHLVRFLESPDLVIGWTKELMRVLLKYGLASRVKALSEELLSLSRKTKALQAMLRDPETSELVVVTLPQEPVIAETERLLKRLRALHIPVRHVIVNQASAANSGVDRLRTTFPGLEFTEIARHSESVQGIRALEKIAA